MRRSKAFLLVSIACAALLAPPTSACAQAPADPAAEAFQRGTEAAAAARWADAEREFRRAHALTGARTALYNLAVALRALGRHREARDTFDAFLHGPEGVDEATAAQARALRDESAAEVAAVEIRGLALGEPHRVRVGLDEHEVVGRAVVRVEHDAGSLPLRVERDGYRPVERRLVLVAGRTERLDLALEPSSSPAAGVDVLSEPLFWIVAGVVVVGAGVATGIALHESAQLAPQSGIGFEI